VIQHCSKTGIRSGFKSDASGETVPRRRGTSGAPDSDGEKSERSLKEADYVYASRLFLLRNDMNCRSKPQPVNQFKHAPRDSTNDKACEPTNKQLHSAASEVGHAVTQYLSTSTERQKTKIAVTARNQLLDPS
jgi:hypothetical protein